MLFVFLMNSHMATTSGFRSSPDTPRPRNDFSPASSSRRPWAEKLSSSSRGGQDAPLARPLALIVASFGAHGRVLGAHGRVLGVHGRVVDSAGPHGRALGAQGRVLRAFDATFAANGRGFGT